MPLALLGKRALLGTWADRKARSPFLGREEEAEAPVAALRRSGDAHRSGWEFHQGWTRVLAGPSARAAAPAPPGVPCPACPPGRAAGGPDRPLPACPAAEL